jgi:hypothetical protein
MHHELGVLDHEAGRVKYAPNPFGAKLLPVSPEGMDTMCPIRTLIELVAGVGFEPTTFGL